MRTSALKAQQDYDVRRLVEVICVGLPSKAYVDEYLALYRFVLTHCRYMRDPRVVELVRSPSHLARALWSGSTPSVDCDDSCCLLCALVLAVGGKCRIVTVAFRNLFHQGNRQYSHVFAQAQEPQTGVWITLDPVAADKTKQMLRRVTAYKIWPVA